MSLFGSLLPGFDDDPFFGGHRSIMRQMDQMMNTMLHDPFNTNDNNHYFNNPATTTTTNNTTTPALPPPPPPQAITGGVHHQGGGAGGGGGGGGGGGVVRRNRNHHHQLAPFGLGIPNIANMMSAMNPIGQGGNCHMYSSSSVMTMTTGPDGKPQVYQATSSTTGVPGGVRETRRTVSDSRTGTRKMAIGHHIGERSHIIEREHNKDNMEERQEFINLDEEEAPQFDREFRQRTQGMGGRGGGSLEYRRHRQTPQQGYSHRTSDTPAIQYTASPSSRYRSRSRPLLSITSGSRDDRARRRDREERGQRSHRRYQPTM